MLKLKTILPVLIALIAVAILMLISVGKKNGKKADSEELKPTRISTLENIERDFNNRRYSDVVHKIYKSYRQESMDSARALALITLSSSKLARMYDILWLFEVNLGKKLHELYVKNRALINNQYDRYFGSIYHYLSGDKNRATSELKNFINLNKNKKRWYKDAVKLNQFFETNKFQNFNSEHTFNRYLFKSLAYKKQSTKPLDDNFKLEKESWKISSTALYLNANNIINYFDKFVAIEFNHSPLYKEKIYEINGAKNNSNTKVRNDGDSAEKMVYAYYFNPFLLKAYANIYKQIAEKFYLFYLDNSEADEIDLRVSYEISLLYQQFEEYDKALNILKDIPKHKLSPIFKKRLDIDINFLKNKKNSGAININNWNNEYLRSYFLMKLSQLEFKPKNIEQLENFNFKVDSRGKELKIYEYLGDYYLNTKKYEKAQAFYQKRQTGKLNLTDYEPFYLINFAQALYYNKINMDVGKGIFVKLTRRYPVAKQIREKYSLIYSEKIFK